jgi:L-2-hydroxyglutarate oxidase LhgO
LTDFDAVVVGAGVVGLACAAELAKLGNSVLVLERNAKEGQETSSRNSGVIHAGIYYPAGSLKATLCVRGRQLLYERCIKHGIPHEKLGKLIVACDESEVETLTELQRRAADNGVILEWMAAERVRQVEPSLKVPCALWSPETGIVDQHQLMLDYRREAVEHDAILAMNTTLRGLEREGSHWVLVTTDPQGSETPITSRCVVNSAGLHASHVAKLAGIDVVGRDWASKWCKGDYFTLTSRFTNVVRHLVYPVPVHAGLGIHLTRDLGGGVQAGPDATYVDELKYDVDATKRELFANAIRRYLPQLKDGDLTPGQAGIRPKLQGPEDPFRDFVIEEASQHGLAGLVNLIGIESPGLTASEAIARRVCELLNRE